MYAHFIHQLSVKGKFQSTLSNWNNQRSRFEGKNICVKDRSSTNYRRSNNIVISLQLLQNIIVGRSVVFEFEMYERWVGREFIEHCVQCFLLVVQGDLWRTPLQLSSNLISIHRYFHPSCSWCIKLLFSFDFHVYTITAIRQKYSLMCKCLKLSLILCIIPKILQEDTLCYIILHQLHYLLVYLTSSFLVNYADFTAIESGIISWVSEKYDKNYYQNYMKIIITNHIDWRPTEKKRMDSWRIKESWKLIGCISNAFIHLQLILLWLKEWKNEICKS